MLRMVNGGKCFGRSLDGICPSSSIGDFRVHDDGCSSGFLGRPHERAKVSGAPWPHCLCGLAFAPKTDASALFDKSNGYHRIRIVTSPDDQEVRTLYLDSTREGAVRLGSSEPVLGYQKNVRQFVETIPRLSHALFVGGGAFTLPRYIKASFPHANVDVVEIDPDVVDCAYKYLELSSEVNVLVGDGRQVLSSRDVTYDLIVNDAFNGFRKIPFHLVSREFSRLVKSRLSREGVYAVNVIGHATKGSLVGSVVRTLMKEFEHVSLFRRHEGNIWILASQTSVTPGDGLPKEDMGGQVLTDNHSPVEFLIVKDLITAQLSTYFRDDTSEK